MGSKVISAVFPLVWITLLELLFLLSDNRCLASDGVSCGQRQLTHLGLIVSGDAAHEGDWPWHAAIFIRNSKKQTYICGGTIISENFILTAAHCTSQFRSLFAPERLLVKLGLHNKSAPYDHTKSHEIVEIIRHVNYNTENMKNDIALLRTEEDIIYSDYIQPICLWPQKKSDLNEVISSSGYVVGWGLGDDSKPMDILQEATLSVVDHATCLKSKPQHFDKLLSEDNSNYCAGNRNKTNVCDGDSGGGMFFRFDNAWYIRGLVSTGARSESSNHCDPQQFVVFTDIPYYLKWIYDHQATAKKRNLLDLGDCGLDEHDITTYELDKPVFLQYPWTAMLEFKGDLSMTVQTFCNGALIHPLFVVTVGHCVDSSLKKYKLKSVRLGEYNQKTNPDVGKRLKGNEVVTSIQSIDVQKVFKHPAFNKPRYDNNIAILKLMFPADISRANVKPICIPTSEDHSEEYIVSGWKRVGKDAHVLTRDKVLLEDPDTCKAVYGKFKIQTTGNHICGTYYQEEIRNCFHFMSGAPMQYVKRVDRKSRYFMKGIFSFGFPGCKHNYTDVFTSINRYTEWISRIVDQEK
ncbi:polyserase-2 [Armigeres subalbatus]|uniref:polyserase-2 n=1 Tax=Armigeres subalbatus TaxID=124917 RepID=UPI002ED09D87